ncbi:MAG: hypothetical protein NC898_06660 [Candidatus Omnitrophica bacterium]|nr:hypothetical protein [Candidatus Omnitrophota bacterium]MCM8794114.1 hypothetical protein [Candidatus Omnitrophota bacterium]
MKERVLIIEDDKKGKEMGKFTEPMGDRSGLSQNLGEALPSASPFLRCIRNPAFTKISLDNSLKICYFFKKSATQSACKNVKFI